MGVITTQLAADDFTALDAEHLFRERDSHLQFLARSIKRVQSFGLGSVQRDAIVHDDGRFVRRDG